MEKRVLIAVLLSIAVMYGYTIIFPPQKSIPQKEEVSKTEVINTPSVATISVPDSGKSSSAADFSKPALKDITVDSDVFNVVIAAKNGAIKKLVLKKYKDLAGAKGTEIVLVQDDKQGAMTVASSYPGFSPESEIYFSSSTDKVSLTGSETKSIELTSKAANGLVFKKAYTFVGNSYSITLDQSVSNISAPPVSGQILLTLSNPSIKPKNADGRFEVFGPVTRLDSGVAFDTIADLGKSEKKYDKGVKWSGFGDKYFLNAVVSKDKEPLTLSLKDSNGFMVQRFSFQKATLNPGQAINATLNLFFGPKDLDILKAQNVQLEGAIDLGWFSAIAKPLLHALKLFYGYLHNYGLAIIVITVILKILFFPLTHKSYKSMKEMQKLQPKMQELKDKFKDDRDGLNRAVMELYKTHKVNPLGGCLPMIVQIPVFFGLYKALMFSIELRHAPFYFWLQDLSAKDPYYVTPIIMGATMFIQQKMTPTNMDPIQAKMMLALPVVFTFMFLNFPSGLVLYWLVNNILTIAQQAYINKTLKET
ncbi:MAG TPA: membrane protein insertase YidC [Geobacteraceae bacterium]|nr:membrane protein insertase YidC [Geobacteraceae bacterium]